METKRLIDAEALKRWLLDAADKPREGNTGKRRDLACLMLHLFCEVVDAEPAVDAVEVVRCKECKHYKEFRTKRHKQIMRLCYRMGKHDMEFFVKPDDFCSYGERKEGGDHG